MSIFKRRTLHERARDTLYQIKLKEIRSAIEKHFIVEPTTDRLLIKCGKNDITCKVIESKEFKGFTFGWDAECLIVNF